MDIGELMDVHEDETEEDEAEILHQLTENDTNYTKIECFIFIH